MLYSGFITLPRSIFWSANFNGRSDNLDVMLLKSKMPKPHPKNASGPFYVEYGCCTACEVPTQEAPDNFAFDSDDHCFVCRQPETSSEFTSLIGAAWMAEFQCIRYRGDDPDVLRRMAELDLRNLCDISPPNHIAPVIRNHVTLLPSASMLPTELMDAYFAHANHENDIRKEYQFKLLNRIVDKRPDRVRFEISWYDNHWHPIEIHPSTDGEKRLRIYYPLKNDLGDRGVGNLLSSWLKKCPESYSQLRWYTDSDWADGNNWQNSQW